MSRDKGQLGKCKLRNSPSSHTADFEYQTARIERCHGTPGSFIDSQEEASLREQSKV